VNLCNHPGLQAIKGCPKEKGFWARTRKLEFIDDKDALPIEVVRRKYGLGKDLTNDVYYGIVIV